MLDTEADAPVRAKIVADARSAIEAQGEMLRHDEWGERALTYPIEHKQAAEYHLLQFHASTPELLRSLNGALGIIDEIVRFRIVKLKPGTPVAPDMRPGRRTEIDLEPHPPHPPDAPQPSAETPNSAPAAESAGAAPDSESAAEQELPVGEPA